MMDSAHDTRRGQPISTLMQREVRSVGMDDSVQSVQELMTREGLVWVPVLDEGGSLVGVISASDLLAFHGRREDAAAVRAWQLCTYKPVSVAPEAPVEEVAALMLSRRVHHVVVMRADSMQGVVSTFDLLRAFAA